MVKRTLINQKRAGSGTKGTTSGRMSTSIAVAARVGRHSASVRINRNKPRFSHTDYLYCETKIINCVVFVLLRLEARLLRGACCVLFSIIQLIKRRGFVAESVKVGPKNNTSHQKKLQLLSSQRGSFLFLVRM